MSRSAGGHSRSLALLSFVALLLVAVAMLFRHADDLALALVGLVVAVAGGWWVVTEGMPRRAVGIVALVVGLCVTGLAVHQAFDEVDGTVFRVALFVVLLAVTLGCAHAAVVRDTRHVEIRVRSGGAPRHTVLLCNPWSGGGKVEKFGLEELAAELNVEAVLLDRGLDLEQLARDAVARGADCLGMAGGDGSQALVASIAIEHQLPFVCVSAGTRNHFALDLGLNRDDPRGSMYAFRDAVERQVDYATVNGRLFVNNVSLGVYAEIVQQESYRDAKVETTKRHASRNARASIGAVRPAVHNAGRPGGRQRHPRDGFEQPVRHRRLARQRGTATPRLREARCVCRDDEDGRGGGAALCRLGDRTAPTQRVLARVHRGEVRGAVAVRNGVRRGRRRGARPSDAAAFRDPSAWPDAARAAGQCRGRGTAASARRRDRRSVRCRHRARAPPAVLIDALRGDVRPARTTLLVAGGLVAANVLLFALIAEDLLSGGGLISHDEGVLTWFVEHRTEWMINAAKFVGTVASFTSLALIAAGLGLWLWRRRGWSAGLPIAPLMSLVLASLASTTAKALFDRDRPPAVVHATTVTLAAFPSGHATDAAAFFLGAALTLALTITRSVRVQGLLIATGLLLAGLVGVSRLVLGVHWLSDVVAGWALGSAVAITVVVGLWYLTTRRDVVLPPRSPTPR